MNCLEFGNIAPIGLGETIKMLSKRLFREDLKESKSPKPLQLISKVLDGSHVDPSDKP